MTDQNTLGEKITISYKFREIEGNDIVDLSFEHCNWKSEEERWHCPDKFDIAMVTNKEQKGEIGKMLSHMIQEQMIDK